MRSVLKTERVAVVIKAHGHVFDVQNRMAFRKRHRLLTSFHAHFLQSTCRGWSGFQTRVARLCTKASSRCPWEMDSHPDVSLILPCAVTVFCVRWEKPEKASSSTSPRGAS